MLMDNLKKDQKLSELFSDDYIQDGDFSQKIFLELNQQNERRIRISKIISTIILMSSILVAFLGLFFVGINNINSFESTIFISTVLLTVMLTLEPETE